MSLWRITAKYSGSAVCKNKKQKLEKGMFVETSTLTTASPLSQIRQIRQQPMLAQLFMSKYGIEVDSKYMNWSHFTFEKIG